MTNTLLTIGHGYSAAALARRLTGWTLYGTTRKAERFETIKGQNVSPLLWPDSDLSAPLAQATHLLLSNQPTAEGDTFFSAYGHRLQKLAPNLRWVGYLSTTGVYGDHQGAWITEGDALRATSRRGTRRIAAEEAWQSTDLPLHIFRLAGIYGPGRSVFDKLRSGKARRIIKPNQFFSRIHVEDIAQTLHASMLSPDTGAIYNLADDLPCPPEDLFTYAAELLGIEPPPEVPFEEAELSEMGRSFYSESKRVSNARIKEELGIKLKYPTYREGLADILAGEA